MLYGKIKCVTSLVVDRNMHVGFGLRVRAQDQKAPEIIFGDIHISEAEVFLRSLVVDNDRERELLIEEYRVWSFDSDRNSLRVLANVPEERHHSERDNHEQ